MYHMVYNNDAFKCLHFVHKYLNQKFCNGMSPPKRYIAWMLYKFYFTTSRWKAPFSVSDGQPAKWLVPLNASLQLFDRSTLALKTY